MGPTSKEREVREREGRERERRGGREGEGERDERRRKERRWEGRGEKEEKGCAPANVECWIRQWLAMESVSLGLWRKL